MPVAVMGYRTWQDHFGGDLSVVNANFTFEGFNFKVVGITPPSFYGETISNIPPALWIPLQTEYLTDAEASYNLVHSSAWLRVIGRLRPGAKLGGASSELTSLLRHWLVSDADMMPNHRAELEQQLPQQSIKIARCATGISALGDEYGKSLKILLAVCAMVLLIVCANVVNLLLARGMTRRAQVSIQSALGASGAAADSAGAHGESYSCSFGRNRRRGSVRLRESICWCCLPSAGMGSRCMWDCRGRCWDSVRRWRC